MFIENVPFILIIIMNMKMKLLEKTKFWYSDYLNNFNLLEALRHKITPPKSVTS